MRRNPSQVSSTSSKMIKGNHYAIVKCMVLVSKYKNIFLHRIAFNYQIICACLVVLIYSEKVVQCVFQASKPL